MEVWRLREMLEKMPQDATVMVIGYPDPQLQSEPDWCFADTITSHADGKVYIENTQGNYTNEPATPVNPPADIMRRKRRRN